MISRKQFLRSACGACLAACSLLSSSCARKQVAFQVDDPVVSAWNEYSLGEFDRAIARFDSVLEDPAADEETRLQALFGLATSWNLRRPNEDPDKARQIYQQIIDQAPANDLAAWSLLGLARMKHLVPVGEEPDYAEVRKAYQQVIDRYPAHLAAEEAFIYLNATLVSSLDEAQTRQALASLEKYVEEPGRKFVGPAYSLIAVCAQTLGDQEKRLWGEERSLQTTEVDPGNPFTEFSWQYWNIATIAEFEAGDFDTARLYYGKLIEEYPQDIRVYAAKQAITRMAGMEQKIREEK